MWHEEFIMVNKIIIALCLFFVTQNAFSQGTESTSELYQQCSIIEETAEEYMHATFCLGYLSGFIDSYRLMDAFNKNNNSKSIACLPNKGINIDYLRNLFLYYVNKSPVSLNDTARITLMKILIIAYPCGR